MATVDWSYNLLCMQECRLLSLLSVFIGGWTLEAAEAVCATPDCLEAGQPVPEIGSCLPRPAILDLLGQLVGKSLVQVYTGQDGQPRYRLLDMISQYGHSRLLESGGIEVLRDRHLDYFRDLAVRAEERLRSRDSREWIERLEENLPNLRKALEWSLTVLQTRRKIWGFSPGI